MTTTMKKTPLKHGFIALVMATALSGCATVLEATHDGPIQPDPGDRSFGTYLDDERIQTIATVNINKADPQLQDANINVNVFNGVVLLTGQAPSNDTRLLAGRTAQRVQNVRQVYNEIQVRGNVSFLASSSDVWLTTKVKSTLMANEAVDSSRIKVITENGVVYLMGLLTRTEAERAANVTRGIGGVQKVVKAVEYID